MKKLILGVAMMMATVFAFGGNVMAATTNCNDGEIETSIIQIGGSNCYKADGDTEGDAIFEILNIVLNTLTFIVSAVGVLGIVITGIQYMTARDNDQQVAKAKMRLIQIVIGLVAYALLFGFLSWLIPGGLM